MGSLENTLRVKRLSYLHDEWCKFSNDLARDGLTINCVIVSRINATYVHPVLEAGACITEPLSDEEWLRIICKQPFSLQEVFGFGRHGIDFELGKLFRILAEFECIRGFSYVPTVCFEAFDAYRGYTHNFDSHNIKQNNFNCWSYQVFSVVNEIEFRTMGLRFCELAHLSAELVGRPPEVCEWLAELASARLPVAQVIHWHAPGDLSSSSLKNYTHDKHCPVILYAAASFPNSIVYESARLIEKIAAEIADPQVIVALTDLQREVLEFVSKNPGKTEQEIAAGIRTEVGKGTLSAHVFPTLREHYGLRNKRGYGYYV